MKNHAFIYCLIILTLVAALAAVDGSALVGKSAPEFSLPRYDGGNVSLSGLRGRVVLVAFLIPSVPECKKAMPQLENLYGQYHQSGLEIVGVDMKSNSKAAAKLKSQSGITFPLVQGDARTALNDWSVSFAPSYFLIDRNGTVVHYYAPEETSNLQRLGEDIVDLLGN